APRPAEPGPEQFAAWFKEEDLRGLRQAVRGLQSLLPDRRAEASLPPSPQALDALDVVEYVGESAVERLRAAAEYLYRIAQERKCHVRAVQDEWLTEPSARQAAAATCAGQASTGPQQGPQADHQEEALDLSVELAVDAGRRGSLLVWQIRLNVSPVYRSIAGASAITSVRACGSGLLPLKIDPSQARRPSPLCAHAVVGFTLKIDPSQLAGHHPQAPHASGLFATAACRHVGGHSCRWGVTVVGQASGPAAGREDGRLGGSSPPPVSRRWVPLLDPQPPWLPLQHGRGAQCPQEMPTPAWQGRAVSLRDAPPAQQGRAVSSEMLHASMAGARSVPQRCSTSARQGRVSLRDAPHPGAAAAKPGCMQQVQECLAEVATGRCERVDLRRCLVGPTECEELGTVLGASGAVLSVDLRGNPAVDAAALTLLMQ
ncbi:hypothetical protein CYMTET_35489, partial [Cymbomonas tetramitiformis]